MWSQMALFTGKQFSHKLIVVNIFLLVQGVTAVTRQWSPGDQRLATFSEVSNSEMAALLASRDVTGATSSRDLTWPPSLRSRASSCLRNKDPHPSCPSHWHPGAIRTTALWWPSLSWSTTLLRSGKHRDSVFIKIWISSVCWEDSWYPRLCGPGAGWDQPRLPQLRCAGQGDQVLLGAGHHQWHRLHPQPPQQLPEDEEDRGEAPELCRRCSSVCLLLPELRSRLHRQHWGQADNLNLTQELRPRY